MLLLMFLMAALLQYTEVILAIPHPAEHTLPFPALWVFMLFLGVGAVVYRFTRLRLLSRPELLCVLFALLIAGPIMTQGVWHRLLAITATIPRTGDFAKIDALSPRMWPHGENLLEGTLVPEAVVASESLGWDTQEVFKADAPQRTAILAGNGDAAFVQFHIEADHVQAGTPYMVSLLAHAMDLGSDSFYYVRAYPDPEQPEQYVQLMRSDAPATPSFIFPSGFVRQGAYDVKLEPGEEGLWLEIGLSGRGRVAIADPQLLDVGALEGAYKGVQIVDESEAAGMSESELVGVVVKPDNLLSLAGIRYILGGYIPVKDWVQPVAAWTVLILLLLTATFALAVLLRRQWIDNERYPMPVTYLTATFLGRDGERPVWKNTVFWYGFGLSLFWCLMRGWNFYNPQVPDMNIEVPLAPYFANSQFAPMWDVTFSVSAIFLSMAMFMELGVLISIVVGYFLFRSLFWMGEVSGMSANAGYPFPAEQQVGSYLVYALLIFVFTRKYWSKLFKAAWRNDKSASEGEAFSYRTALILVGLCIAGSMGWASWVGVKPVGILLFFLFMVLTGLVSAKIRAECGTPFGYFSPYNGVLIISLLGGLSVFGAGSVLIALMASFMLFVTAFFLIPGAQVELLEMGRQYQVKPRHLFYAMLAGVIGGMVIGGWVFLSNAYAWGGDSMKYSWAFEQKSWYFFGLNQDLTLAAQNLNADGAAAAQSGVSPATWAYVYGAIGTVILAVLRQMFAGFWFHPVGFILSSSWFTWYIWGSCLVAWILRLVVLKVGGAATVRDRLRPFFIGFFIAAVLSQLIFTIHAGFLAANGIEDVYRAIP